MEHAGNALVAFRGEKVDRQLAAVLADPRTAGVTLYGSMNIRDAAQTRQLTSDLVAAAGRPLLIAVDQEGGQLTAAGPDTTPFAGNMALGAVGDQRLTREVASAMGRELRSLGINVNYAPVADVATRPDNPSLGIRSFGEDPTAVADLTRAFVAGLQKEGVAATLKHFPGKGDASVDPHDEMPALDLDRSRLEVVEFPPFRAGVEAGARLIMVGHYGLPAVTGDRRIPTSASTAVLEGLIRGHLGFDGLIITDALDMGGFAGVAPESPLEAGVDLLLYGPAQAGSLPSVPASPSPRLGDLHGWLAGFPTPDPGVLGCADHRTLAAELAARSITLIRDDLRLIPLRLDPAQRLLAVMVRPAKLTPADTSDLVIPGLSSAISRHHPNTTELLVEREPGPARIAEAVEAAAAHDAVVVGTIDAGPSQGVMVEQVVATGTPTVAVSLRTPNDVARYPSAPTCLCSYGILPPTMNALADALFGTVTVEGRLPVSIAGLYPIGHGLVREAIR